MKRFRFLLEQVKFIFTKDFRLLCTAILSDAEIGLINCKGSQCTCKYNKNTHSIIEVKYAAQNQILPEYTMIYTLDRKTKKVHRVWSKTNE